MTVLKMETWLTVQQQPTMNYSVDNQLTISTTMPTFEVQHCIFWFQNMEFRLIWSSFYLLGK